MTNRTEQTKFHKVKGLCGAMVARLAPYQKVVCSNHVRVKLFLCYLKEYSELALCNVTCKRKVYDTQEMRVSFFPSAQRTCTEGGLYNAEDG